MLKFIGLITGLLLLIFGLVTAFEALIFPPIIIINLLLIIAGIYLINKYSHRIVVGIISTLVIIGMFFYYISQPYKGIKIIQTDLGPKIEENQATNGTGVYVIPDYTNGMHILVTRGNRLYGVNSNSEYKETSVAKTVLNIQDNGYIGDHIGKLVLGCNLQAYTCFILDFTFDHPSSNYSPAKIIGYNYFTQTFSNVYTFPTNLQNPLLVHTIIKYPDSAIVIISTISDNVNYLVNFQNAQVSQVDKIPDKQGGKELTFLVRDQNYFANNKYLGLVSGDSVWTVVSKSECGGGGLTGCDTSVSVLKNDKQEKIFNCHNCSAYYMGRLQNKLLLLIEENLKFKIGEIEIKE